MILGYDNIRETVAEAVHNAWMDGRSKEGWKYGKKKDILRKTDPNICDYSELTESEKEYDRKTAEAVIETLLANGYTIEKK